jgi:hypothetical protein
LVCAEKLQVVLHVVAANLMSKFCAPKSCFLKVKKAENLVEEFDGTSTNLSAFVITSFRERMK